jgi:hypothetical protein
MVNHPNTFTFAGCAASSGEDWFETTRGIGYKFRRRRSAEGAGLGWSGVER